MAQTPHKLAVNETIAETDFDSTVRKRAIFEHFLHLTGLFLICVELHVVSVSSQIFGYQKCLSTPPDATVATPVR